MDSCRLTLLCGSLSVVLLCQVGWVLAPVNCLVSTLDRLGHLCLAINMVYKASKPRLGGLYTIYDQTTAQGEVLSFISRLSSRLYFRALLFSTVPTNLAKKDICRSFACVA